MNDVKTDINKRMNKTDAYMDKYNHAGVYAIYIDGVLAYIGQSVNMERRISQHLTHIKNPYKVNYGQRNKYIVLRNAYDLGHTITFDVIYYATKTEPIEIQREIERKEGVYLRKYKPPLNLCITKRQHNEIAKTITLDELLKLDKTTIESAYK